MNERKLTMEFTRREAVVIAGTLGAVIELFRWRGADHTSLPEMKMLLERFRIECTKAFDDE